eukprot:1235678-Pleurochrysis_carterae.AAC.1
MSFCRLLFRCSLGGGGAAMSNGYSSSPSSLSDDEARYAAYSISRICKSNDTEKVASDRSHSRCHSQLSKRGRRLLASLSEC